MYFSVSMSLAKKWVSPIQLASQQRIIEILELVHYTNSFVSRMEKLYHLVSTEERFSNVKENIRTTDVLMIDEISMNSA